MATIDNIDIKFNVNVSVLTTTISTLKNMEKVLININTKFKDIGKTGLNDVNNSIKKVTSEMTKADKATVNLNKALDKSKSDEVNKVAIAIEKVSSKSSIAERALKTLSNIPMSKIADSLNNVGQKLQSLGSTMYTNVTMPIIKGFGAAIKIGMEFEATMAKVQAMAGVSAKEMSKLSDKAKEMGIKTKFSAKDAGDAMYYLASAGWKTQDMLDGLEGIMNLAAAANEDLARTTDIVVGTMKAFKLEASDSARFSDVLARAASNSNTNIAMMGEAFKYVAPAAGVLGYKIEDVALAIGLMANNNIKAGKAGTYLRTGMMRLASPTKQMVDAMKALNISMTDSKGIKPFAQLIGELRTKFQGLTKDQQLAAASNIFGKQAASGWLAMITASEKDFNKLSLAIKNSSGATKEMAEIQLATLSGKITLVKSSLQGLGIKLYETLNSNNALKKIIDVILKLVNSIADLPKPIFGAVAAFLALLAIIGPLLMVFGTLVGWCGFVATGITVLIGAFTSILLPIGIVIAAIGGIGITLGALLLTSQEIRNGISDVFGGIVEKIRAASEWIKKHSNDIKNAFLGLWKALNTGDWTQFSGSMSKMIGDKAYKSDGLVDMIKKFEKLKTAIVDVRNAIVEFIRDFKRQLEEAAKNKVINDIINNYIKSTSQMIDTVVSLKNMFSSIGTDGSNGKGKGKSNSKEKNSIVEMLEIVNDLIIFTTKFGSFLQTIFDSITAIQTTGGKASKAINDFADSVINMIKNLPGNIGDFFVKLWDGAKTKSSEAWESIKTVLSSVWDSIKNTANNVWNGIISAIIGAWNWLKITAVNVWNSIVNGIVNSFIWLYNHNYYFEAMVNLIVDTWNWLKITAVNVWNGITTFLVNTWNWVSTTATNIWNAITLFITNTWNWIATTAINIWSSITTFIVNAWNTIYNFIASIIKPIVDVVVSAWNWIATTTSSIFNSLWQIASNAFKWLSDTIFGKAEEVKKSGEHVAKSAKDGVTSIFDSAWQWGANLCQKIADGIRSGANAIAQAAKDAANAALEALGFHDLGGSSSSKSTPKHAIGTRYSLGGMALVGEQGAELVNLPRGSQVYNSQQTRSIMNNSSNRNVTINYSGSTGTDDKNRFTNILRTAGVY